MHATSVTISFPASFESRAMERIGPQANRSLPRRYALLSIVYDNHFFSILLATGLAQEGHKVPTGDESVNNVPEVPLSEFFV
jgi:hypothetical protein